MGLGFRYLRTLLRVRERVSKKNRYLLRVREGVPGPVLRSSDGVG